MYKVLEVSLTAKYSPVQRVQSLVLIVMEEFIIDCRLDTITLTIASKKLIETAAPTCCGCDSIFLKEST